MFECCGARRDRSPARRKEQRPSGSSTISRGTIESVVEYVSFARFLTDLSLFQDTKEHQPTEDPVFRATSAKNDQVKALVIRWFDRGTILPNLQDPRAYTPVQKGIIVAIVAACSFSAPFASNILMPSFPFIGPSLRLHNSGVTLTSGWTYDD
jgi:hypothetical protein